MFQRLVMMEGLYNDVGRSRLLHDTVACRS
jgi:hypothetical protein